MRYIFRRPKPEDIAELRPQIEGMDEKLGTPQEKARRFVKVAYTPVRYAQYTFLTRKVGTEWVWVAPSVELVAENEAGLFALTEKFHLPKPSHLAHL